jgi:diguanylate cyclase (GGDEF)-like protein/PAS domain S-box-containing protein
MCPASPAPPPRDQRAGDAEGPLLPAGVDIKEFLDRIPAILYISEAGADGRWFYVSRGVESILGFTAEEWMGDPGLWARQIDHRDRQRVLEREADQSQPSVPEEYRMRDRRGETVWVRDEAALVAGDDGVVHWHGVISAITDRKVAERELTLRAQQQAAVATLGRHALEGAPLAALIDEALESAVRLEAFAAAAILELRDRDDTREVRAQAGTWAATELDRVASSAQSAAAGATGARPPQRGLGGVVMLPIATPRGSWGQLALKQATGAPLDAADVDFAQTLANTLSSVIARRAAEARVRHEAVHDPLTGLPNRVLLLERLGQSLQVAGARLAVILLDIDNFKLINDSLGHAAGDELLMQVAPRLRGALRPGDEIGRFGGDEFVVIVRGTADERGAAAIAARIVAAFESPFKLSAREHFAKVSVGVALVDPARSTPVSLLRDADAALYEAKNRGRARFEIFDSVMRTRTVERLAIEDDLRKALERDELHVAYQPVVALRDGSIRSLEALLRWRHPTRGPMQPGEFVPVAEESGMIGEIGRWVLRTACEQCARWRSAAGGATPVGIAVNLSARQFTSGELEADLTEILAATGLDPEALALEITESLLLENPEAVRETIERITRLGVRFVLDDFGTGYSSLAYLAGLPIDGLKVDRSFVAALGVNERSTAITTAVVRMAQALSLEVVAEGVETEDQARELHKLGCELAQGFLFHRPTDADTVASLLARTTTTRSRRLAARKRHASARADGVAGAARRA